MDNGRLLSKLLKAELHFFMWLAVGQKPKVPFWGG